MSESGRYLLISVDCHAGPRAEDARDYLDPVWRPVYDEWRQEEDRRSAQRSAPLFAEEAQEEFEAKEKVSLGGMDGIWDSQRRLKELDEDGVVAEVIFPQGGPFGVGLAMYQFEQDPARWQAGTQAYNRWLADFCDEVPGRRAGGGLITCDDIDATVKEVTWLKNRGVFGGILLPGGAIGIGNAPPAYNHPCYEPLWAACADLQMPVHTHSGWTPNFGPYSGSVGILLAEMPWWAHRPFWFMVWAGVFERHPELRLIMSEQKADWMIPTLELLDSRYESLPMFRQLRKQLPMKPSAYYKRQVWIGASFMDEGEWETRHQLGIDKLMWGSDYPHMEGCWPHTLETLKDIFAGVARSDVARMVGGTAADVYRFDVEKLLPLAADLGPPLESIGA